MERAEIVMILLGGTVLLLLFAALTYVNYRIISGRNRAGKEAVNELEKARKHVQEIWQQKRQEQLNALQNQINPHFLYNTLDTIRGLAIEQDAMDVADIVATLSSMFKYSMDYASFLVPVNGELEHLNSFLKIQKIRFPLKFTFCQVMECEPQDLKQIQMPKLVLQPIVENVFTHGFRKMSVGGKIELRLVATDVEFQMIITDNGTGIEDEQVLALNQMFRNGIMMEEMHSGIALYNINSRIKMYCGEAYGLHIASTPGFGTEVTISLPVST
ncbi:MAG: histidine kinase [Lachnospiraceae bacterium]|jgi:sensor histidine kinase YesM|nr:histidine kinase [Lachnospiraceae bacterium]